MSPDSFKSELIQLLPRLKRYALTLTRSAPDADDLVQDACMSALKKWKQYDASKPLERWLFTILRNQWISEIRKQSVRQGQGQVAAEDAIELSADNNADDVILAKQVQGKITNLPSELSQPLLLVCAEGYSYQEASKFLEVPIGTIMSRIHRARKILSSQMNVGETK
ncbi:MAG: RNA polymerase sigma factor [Nitratireductor sp.]